MKQIAILIYLTILPSYFVFAQCPNQWAEFTKPGYFYDCAQQEIEKKQDEQEVLAQLTKKVTEGIAKQFKIKVSSAASLNAEVVQGKTKKTYTSSADFETNVSLEFLQTKQFYDKKAKTAYAIAYIEKKQAREFYKTEIVRLQSQFKDKIISAKELAKLQEYTKAKQELNETDTLIALLASHEEKLSIFGYPDTLLVKMGSKTNKLKDERSLLSIEYDKQIAYQKRKSVFILSEEYLFDDKTLQIKDLLTNRLLEDSVIIEKLPNNSRFKININAKAREYSNPYGTFVVYVDAKIAITDNSADNRNVFQKSYKQKGNSAMSYKKAADVAYKKAAQIISDDIIDFFNKK